MLHKGQNSVLSIRWWWLVVSDSWFVRSIFVMLPIVNWRDLQRNKHGCKESFKLIANVCYIFPILTGRGNELQIVGRPTDLVLVPIGSVCVNEDCDVSAGVITVHW